MENQEQNSVHIYTCPNCCKKYYFFEKLYESRCENCGNMIVKCCKAYEDENVEDEKKEESEK